MIQTFRTVFLFLMLAIFLTGTMGVSFSLHECTSSRKTEVFPFPEIFNNTVACCCAEEVHGSSACEEPVSSINDPGCCKNTHHYLKALFTGFPVFYQFIPDLFQKIIPADLMNLLHSDLVSEITTLTPRVDHPPPRYGKILIHFLQQIKIPSPVS